MPIRTRPLEGQHMIIGSQWMEPNAFFVQYMPNLAVGKVYEIVGIAEMPGEPDEWGISIIKDIETEEIFDISQHPELGDYWCLFDKDDAVRLVEI